MTSDDPPSERDESTAEPPVRIRHTWSDSDCPSAAVIEATAATTDREPTSMAPLHQYVDPDALNALMTPRTNGTTNDIRVSFTYGDVTVQIDSSGWVEIQPDGTDRE